MYEINTNRFEPGARVRVRQYKAEWGEQAPFFTEPMRNYCGKEYIIEEITEEGYIHFDIWYWSPEWLELITNEEEEAESDVDPAAFDKILFQ